MVSPGQKASGFAPLSTLMPGIEPGLLDHLDQRSPVRGLLPDGFVEQDDAGDAVGHGLGGAEQQLAIVAPAGFRGVDADGGEALLDRAARLVGGENAPAGRHHGVCHSAQLSEVHDPLHPPKDFPALV